MQFIQYSNCFDFHQHFLSDQHVCKKLFYKNTIVNYLHLILPFGNQTWFQSLIVECFFVNTFWKSAPQCITHFIRATDDLLGDLVKFHFDVPYLLHRFYPWFNTRAFSTNPGKVSRNFSTCSGSVSLPSVTRKEPRPQARDRPMAFITSLGSGLPVLQAEPEEQAKPAASRRVNSKFPSTF